MLHPPPAVSTNRNGHCTSLTQSPSEVILYLCPDRQACARSKSKELPRSQPPQTPPDLTLTSSLPLQDQKTTPMYSPRHRSSIFDARRSFSTPYHLYLVCHTHSHPAAASCCRQHIVHTVFQVAVRKFYPSISSAWPLPDNRHRPRCKTTPLGEFDLVSRAYKMQEQDQWVLRSTFQRSLS